MLVVSASGPSPARRDVVRQGSLDACADPSPANIRDRRHGREARGILTPRLWRVLLRTRRIGVVHEQRLATDVLTWHHAPVTAVLRAVAIVAHHEVVTRGHDERAPVVMRRLRGRCTEARIRECVALLPLEERIDRVGFALHVLLGAKALTL